MTTDNPKDVKVVFAEGCFDNFEGTQEELDAFVTEINRMVESGEIFENSKQLDIDNMDTEEMIKLAKSLGMDLSEFGIDADIEPRKLQ